MLIERQSGINSMLMVSMPTTIVKRDGRIVPFDIERIENAMARCFPSAHRTPVTPIHDLSRQVVNIIAARSEQPTVEAVQDTVEMVLQAAGEYEAAKRYILYRAEHAKQRKERPVPEPVREAFAGSDRYFPTQLQKFQFYDKYSRFNYELGRRETWIETVTRALDYLHELSEGRLPVETYERVRRGIAPVLEARRLFPRMTVYENLEMGAYTQRRGPQFAEDLERVFTLFPRVKERLRQLAGTLSGGEQQMVAIGRALMARPKLLCMDEPSMGLSPALVEQVFDIIKEINRQGTTIFVVEQNANMALSIASRGYVLQTGQVVLSGTAQSLRENEMIRSAYLGELKTA